MIDSLIHEPTVATLSKLAAIQGDDRCVLAVYFPAELTKGRKAREKLADLPADVLEGEGLTRDEAEHLRRSLDLWRAVVTKMSFPSAPGWVGVVSWLTEEAAFMPLPSEPKPAAYLDNSPFLLPAARLLDDLEACAVVYADHARATIFLAALGSLHEESRLRGDIKNHVRKGGWSQQRYERRRDKQIHIYCGAVIKRLAELLGREGVRRIVLAGDRFLLNELEKEMTAAMQKLVVSRLAMEGKRDPRDIFRETLSSAAEEETREERRLRDAIQSEHGAGGRAVIGATDTLTALKENRVRWLLVGPMEDTDFWRCGACGNCGLGESTTCPECGGDTYPQSAANEFMDLAFAANSRVEFTSDNLQELNGVGALLRW
jgi:peptide subunit release factor 1 (eRF1)